MDARNPRNLYFRPPPYPIPRKHLNTEEQSPPATPDTPDTPASILPVSRPRARKRSRRTAPSHRSCTTPHAPAGKRHRTLADKPAVSPEPVSTSTEAPKAVDVEPGRHDEPNVDPQVELPPLHLLEQLLEPLLEERESQHGPHLEPEPCPVQYRTLLQASATTAVQQPGSQSITLGTQCKPVPLSREPAMRLLALQLTQLQRDGVPGASRCANGLIRATANILQVYHSTADAIACLRARLPRGKMLLDPALAWILPGGTMAVRAEARNNFKRAGADRVPDAAFFAEVDALAAVASAARRAVAEYVGPAGDDALALARAALRDVTDGYIFVV